jgi:hypothetical protein
MIEERFIELIEPVLSGCGAVREAGDEFREPPLDVLRYDRRAVRLGRVPVLGKALSVVSLVRQPVDIEGSRAGYARLLERIARAANGRFPPWRGFAIGMTSIVLTPEPIQPEDDAMLGQVLDIKLRRMRVVPFGLFRVNLGQEALALAMRASPDDLFPEAARLADALCEQFRRYVPQVEM